jgi:hypothetical protein
MLPISPTTYFLLPWVASASAPTFNSRESALRYTFCPPPATTLAMSRAASILRSLMKAGFSLMA